MSKSIVWADKDDDDDIFSPENIKKFLKEWKEENIRMGLLSNENNMVPIPYKKNKNKNKRIEKK